MLIDSISTRYITLACELDQHIEGLVDAYFGPPELRQQVANRSPRLPQALAADLADLRDEVQASDYPPRRKAYLDVQLRALLAMANGLHGQTLPYTEEVHAYFDIVPEAIPETVFDDAARELNTLLPGRGPVAERMTAWREQFEVPPDVARQMIDRIAAEARTRTLALIGLPDGDEVEFQLVSDKPWSGYNWYLGGARSRIDINTDLPMRANLLLDLVCHEAYPGHHTEHALKERHLYQERGWGEHTIQLINTPECVISEGIATLAAEIIFGEDGATWISQEIYPLGGIVGDPEQEQRIAAASRALRAVAGNAALLLHEQGADPETVVQYLMRYSLSTEREARQRMRFISSPLWRAYIFTYYVGRDLLGRWLRRGDRTGRFRTLLVEQIYPSLVEGWVLEEERVCLRG